MLRRAMVVPSTTDLNRGDQAIAWQAVEIAKKVGFDDVGIFGDLEGEEGKQSLLAGLRVMAPLIALPRRGAAATASHVNDRMLTLIQLALNSLVDVGRMVWILAMANIPGLCNWSLNSNQRKTFDEFRQSEVIFVKGGGFLHGQGGPHWLYYFIFQLFPVFLAKRLGIPVVVLPNSVGPVKGYWSRFVLRQALKGAKLITTREAISATTVLEITGEKPAVYPDLAFGLRCDRVQSCRENLIAAGIPLEIRRCIGVTVRPWRFDGSDTPEQDYKKYIMSVAEFLREAVGQGFHPVFFAHTIGPSAHEDDRVAIREVTALLDDVDYSVFGSPADTCLELIGYYAHMEIMLATRFHSVIFATIVGTPSIVIAYGGNKGPGIMADMGLGEYVVPIEKVTTARLRSSFESLLQNQETVRKVLVEYRHNTERRLDELVTIVRKRLVG